MQAKRTKLELLLLCSLIGQIIFFFAANREETLNLTIYGPSSAALIVFSVLAAIYLYLIYGLFQPTVRVLIIGAIFCAAGIIHVVWPSGMWGWSMGLTIQFRLFEVGNAVMSMNISNFILCILFLKALSNKKALANVTADT